jgi:hypothetical protein
MDYLDRELASYQEYHDATCEICGETSYDDWQCNCCRECSSSSCECDDENIVERQIQLQK